MTESGGGGALDRTLLKGLAWTGAAKWATQLLTWASTLIVARFLSPDDYGLVGMAMVFLGLVELLNEFGLGASIVIHRKLQRSQLRQLNTVALVMGLGCLVLGVAAAGPIARFFEADRLPAVIAVLSTGFLISAFRTVPFGLLEKELRFPRLAVIETARSLVTAVTTLVLAIMGYGYWTLVMGNLVGAFTGTVLAVGSRPEGFERPRRGIGSVMTVSSHIIVSRLAWFVYSRSDFLIVGKMLGETALGFYSFGWTLASLPIEKIVALVARVTPAVFSRVKHEPEEMRRYTLGITEGISLIVFPVAVGFALTAEPLVLLALGETWRGTIAPLQLLALYASFRAVTPLWANVLYVTGHTVFAMRVSILAAVVLPIGFYVGAGWGTVGVAAAWMVLHPLVTLPLLWRTLRVLDLRLWRYLVGLWPALSGCMLMGAAVLSLQNLLGPVPAETSQLVARLAAEVATGVFTYGATLLVLHRRRLSAAMDLVRALRAN